MKIIADPVDVIAKFIAKEKPVPIKFRYQDNEVKVDTIIEVEEIRESGLKIYVYRCQSSFGGQIKRYELKYFLDKCSWQLFKI